MDCLSSEYQSSVFGNIGLSMCNVLEKPSLELVSPLSSRMILLRASVFSVWMCMHVLDPPGLYLPSPLGPKGVVPGGLFRHVA